MQMNPPPRPPQLTLAHCPGTDPATHTYTFGHPAVNRSFQLNALAPFYTWMEEAGGRGTPFFLTGAGGALQGFFQGYVGLRLTDAALVLVAPQLPPGATRVLLRAIAYLGARFDLAIEDVAVSVWMRSWAAVADAASFVVVDAAGNRHDLTAGGVPVVLLRQTVSITAV